MDPESIEQAMKSSEGSGQSIGLRNVNERIKLFGHEYGISLKSEPAAGTEVTIVLPKLTIEEKVG